VFWMDAGYCVSIGLFFWGKGNIGDEEERERHTSDCFNGAQMRWITLS